MTRDTIVGTLHGDDHVQGALSVGGGVSSYNELTDLPTFNGVEWTGNLTSGDVGIYEPFDITTTEKKTGFKYNGKDVYVKTFNNLSLSIPSSGTWVYTGCYIDNLETILLFNINDGTNCWNPILLYASPQLIIASGFAFTAVNIIIYYTKTV